MLLCRLRNEVWGIGDRLGVAGQKVYLGLDYALALYLFFEIGSLASQLQTVAEIWLDEDDAFSRVFGLLYRKMG